MMPQSDPIGELFKGIQTGAAIRGIQQQQEDRAYEMQQREKAQKMQEQYAIDLQNAVASRTPDAWAQMTAKYPQQREAFKQSWEMMSAADQKHEFSQGLQAHIALQNNNIPAAKKVVETNIQALEAQGKDAGSWKQILETLDTNPEAAYTMSGLYLSSVDPEKWAKATETFGKAQKQPFELIEAEAKAGTAKSEQVIKEVEAKYIEPKTLQAIQKTGLDMKKILADIDIAKQNSRIAAMNAQTNRETNSLKRQELGIKVAEAQTKLNDSIREKVASADSAISTSDNILNSIDRILAVPKGVRESAHGPISSKVPTISSDTADYEALLDTLGSQSFLAQISSMKGMGALSDAEGKKLQAGMQNLSLTQSAEQAEKNVREMKKLMLKARKNIEVKYGIKAKPPESSFMSDENSKSIFDKYGIK